MSEQSNDKQDLDQDVDLSRRKLAKVGVAAPVIMTLASKPVFGGALCLSQMMSGNMSQTGDGSCRLGLNYDTWTEPTSAGLWVVALGGTEDSTYGAPKPNWSDCGDFTGGKHFNAYFPGARNQPMRKVLCKPGWKIEMVNGGGSNAESRCWIAAFLNSKYDSEYILTTDQVLCLWDGTQDVPPGYMSLNDFFEDTW